MAWLSVRSHSVADSARVLDKTEGPVLTIGLPHLLREWGAFYRPDRPFLTAETAAELPVALDVLDGVGAAELTVIARVAWTDSFDGRVDLVVARYHRT